MESNELFGSRKMWHHLDRIAQWQNGKLPYPVAIQMDVTNRCQHACPNCQCSVVVGKAKIELPVAIARRTITEFAECGVKSITFSGGGEPLLYGETPLLELMHLAHGCDMDVALVTNGNAMTDFQGFASVCRWIRYSIDAHDAESFTRMHGLKAFDKVMENLKSLCKKKYITTTVGVGILTKPEFGREWYMNCCRTFAEIEGLDYIQFRPVVHWDKQPAPSDEYQCIEEARNVYQIDKFFVVASEEKYSALNLPHFGRTYTRCHASFLHCTIGADACVYICCHGQGRPEYKLGDLHYASFADIWNGDLAASVRNTLNTLECLPACHLHGQNCQLQRLLKTPLHKNFI